MYLSSIENGYKERILTSKADAHSRHKSLDTKYDFKLGREGISKIKRANKSKEKCKSKCLSYIVRERELKGLTSKVDKHVHEKYNGTIHIIFYKPLRTDEKVYIRTRLSKAANTNQLNQQLNTGEYKEVDKEKNGIIAKKTTEPIVKAVQPSSRTHQNFEASTRYKTRIEKNAIKTKCTGHMPTNIDSSICLLYTSPSPRDRQKSRMPSSA